MDNKLQSIMNIMDNSNLQAIIITDGYNMHALSGYKGHTGCILYVADKQYILTDSRYTEQAAIEAPQLTCVDIGRDGYSKTVTKLIKPYVEQFLKSDIRGGGGAPSDMPSGAVSGEPSDVPSVLPNEMSSEMSSDVPSALPNDMSSGEPSDAANEKHFLIGFENEHISYSQFMAFYDAFRKEYGTGVKFFELKGRINQLRVVKTEDELACLAKAEQIGDMAFAHILDYIKQGKTEMEVALELEYFMRSHGASGLSFDTIVASGPNSSLPHAVPTERVLQEGDFVTMDFGCVYKGYCSDMTRTIFIGDEPSAKQQEIYDIVLKAQLAALDVIKPGMKCSEVDAVARNIIKAAGYGDYFGHGLGHGVGLFIHEEPRFSPKCDEVLKPGVVITVEPGIYLPGEFGVRIEDMIQITEDGYRNLASSPKELQKIVEKSK